MFGCVEHPDHVRFIEEILRRNLGPGGIVVRRGVVNLDRDVATEIDSWEDRRCRWCPGPLH